LLRRGKALLWNPYEDPWNPYEDPSKAHSADIVGDLRVSELLSLKRNAAIMTIMVVGKLGIYWRIMANLTRNLTNNIRDHFYAVVYPGSK
jgi:hypothetical protein